MKMLTGNRQERHELLILRTFAAPRDLVFKAWTDPECMLHWAGPKGFTAKGDQLDVRPGGSHRACLIAPNGQEHWVSGKYLEVLPPRRLVFTHAWELANGERSPETVVTVDLTEEDGATQMRFHQAFFESVASRDGHEGGWTESFERLAQFLDTDSSGASEP
jgi:uncharacterized protein YndB with AHSA1/START domain